MNRLLVPIDFSDTSINAARYAAHLAAELPNTEIVLYHVFDKIEAGTDGTPLQDDDADRRAIAELTLQSVHRDISGIFNEDILVVAEKSDHCVDAIANYVRQNNISLIVMGITGANRLSQRFMGSNTLEVVKRRIAPVIIVPPDAQFKGSSNIMFISDFKGIDNTMPMAEIKSLLNLFAANLQIVNVDQEHYIELSDSYKTAKQKLDEMFKEFNPQFSFLRMFDFVDSINQFVEDNGIDLILMISKDHSYFSSIFKPSHTSRLAYQSHVPILSIHA